eukprot:TRINITY_DN3264_c0_g2_i2.p1 TRINITY_DN3264_c0_g2~~TRINITY_DN3264_c0_g2_i2.p1  ORF type:complete len:561 (+),score=164.05 TRINITY_DN3264_c0_g2_i2:59-1684(+)
MSRSLRAAQLASVLLSLLAAKKGYTKWSASLRARRNSTACADKDFKVLIIGAGFSGLAAAIKLRELGIPFRWFEKRDSIGGTWYDNRYPGCQCDVPSYLYSLSAYPAPAAGWKTRFSYQPDILAYMYEVLDHFDLRKAVEVSTEVKKAVWDKEQHKWFVTYTRHGAEACEAFDAVFSGMGGLHVPYIPKFPGLETFKGQQMHTATWDSNITFDGKKVAVVGSAASAVQAIPHIAKHAAHLTVFQRTPNWVLPKEGGEQGYSTITRHAIRYVPFLRHLIRSALYWRNEWVFWFLFYGKTGIVYNMLYKAMTHYIRRKCPRYADVLIPDYKIGCKRILLSNTYYPALMRENVELVGGVDAVREGGLVTGGRTIEADVIVWATGFDVRGEAHTPVQVVGEDGVELATKLKQTSESYLGAMTPGYPNFFHMLGPNSGLGHNSVLVMVEAQLEFHTKALEALLHNPSVASIAIKESVTSKYNQRIQQQLQHMVWATGGCKSWYKNHNGKVDAIYPSTCEDFVKECQAFDLNDFATTSPSCSSPAKL